MVGIPDHEDPDIGGVMGRVKFEMKDTMLTEYAACLYPKGKSGRQDFSDQEKTKEDGVRSGGAFSCRVAGLLFYPGKG